jgi:signal peptidase II
MGAALVLLDLGSKTVIGTLVPHRLNTGFVFGLSEDVGPWLFFGLLLLMIVDVYRRGFRLSETMIIAGGIGNVVDRFTRGAVLDWIRFGSIWFNLGDVWITLGVGWILLFSLRTKRFS